jgi:large subunit ribosomal protein L23
MDILLKPIVTEKMTNLSDKLNRFGFVVSNKANKLEIKNAIQQMYGVNVKSVNTIRYAGKQKVRYTKSGYSVGSKSAFKKAIVTLSEGEKIDFYSNI